MQDRKSQKNFERALMHEMEKIKIAARQWYSNNTKGYRDYRSRESLKEFQRDSHFVYELKLSVAIVALSYKPKMSEL